VRPSKSGGGRARGANALAVQAARLMKKNEGSGLWNAQES
jgi:hypothetical protein